MFGFQYLGARLFDLVDRFQSGFVVLGGQVDFDQIVVHLVRILRIREIVQEVFEDRHRLAESRKGRFVDQQCVVIHGDFLYLFVERRGGSSLECHAGIVFVA